MSHFIPTVLVVYYCGFNTPQNKLFSTTNELCIWVRACALIAEFVILYEAKFALSLLSVAI
jgi:hypothetical protein